MFVMRLNTETYSDPTYLSAGADSEEDGDFYLTGDREEAFKIVEFNDAEFLIKFLRTMESKKYLNLDSCFMHLVTVEEIE